VFYFDLENADVIAAVAEVFLHVLHQTFVHLDLRQACLKPMKLRILIW
jgi:hypothetical protein